MQIGICIPPTELPTLPTPPDFIDYIEGHVQQFLLPEREEEAFELHLEALRAGGKSMPACNSLFPPDLKTSGPAVDEARIDAYIATAFRRAHVAGISLVVFGSGAARLAPPGFATVRAFEQYVGALRRFAPVAAQYGITILVEPLQQGECNVINTIREGAEAVRRADHGSVRLLVDLFHMLRNGESPHDITDLGPLIRHAHVAENKDRAAPGVHGEDFRPFLRALRAGGYNRRLTIEAVWTDLPRQVQPAVAELRRQLADAGY